MLQIDGFEKIFPKYFQKNITLRIGDEEIKTGKFLLIQNHVVTNNFYFELVIENTKKIISFKLPYPFADDEYPDEGILYLDYRFKTLTNKKDMNILMEQIYATLNPPKPSKFIDRILEIEFT